MAATASSTVSVRTEWLACMPALEGPSGIRPGVGFRPTMLLSAAGTRPEPAASPPSARLARPAATTTPPPEVEPPEMWSAENTQRGTP